MNDQTQMMNQPHPPLMMNPMMNQSQLMNPQQQSQLIAQSQALNQPTRATAAPQGMQIMHTSQQMGPPMMNRPYKAWIPNQQAISGLSKPGFVPKQGRSNWKGKKVGDKRKDVRRMDNKAMVNIPNVGSSGPSVGGGGYKPPSLNELQSQNRMKAKKFYHPKRKFNNNRFAPYAPRNTSSYIIRAKKSGGIASLVSPCPVTPAVLPTPVFSPSREMLGDMAKEEWGVDGYGSMKGLIRLRNDAGEGHDEEEDEEGGGGSSDSDVEEHVEVERRLDHDLSRFEMVYPNYGLDYNNLLENRVDDQDTHIAQLEEENLTLKERLFLMEREVAEMRRRLQYLERQNQVAEDVNEEVVENVSENESDGGVSDMHALGGEGKEDGIEFVSGNEEGRDDYDNAKDEHKHDVMLENGMRDDYVIQEDSTVKVEEVNDAGGRCKNVLDETGAEKDMSEEKSLDHKLTVLQVTEGNAQSENDDESRKAEAGRSTLKMDESEAALNKDVLKDEGEKMAAEQDGKEN